MKNEGVRFAQSPGEFPARVTLGDTSPAWGISRWAGQGLRFVPPDDEGFAVRGGARRLLYKGRRRSHRFTVLGDAAFEYDCILEKEPKSNIVTLFMEGAEGFDFFRQPDCVKNPLLAGSYAVYKKETCVGEGTGKLCHVHRPEILDSRGRRCWGDLFVAGSRLCVVIPEAWLANAAYPVIVDPIIGLSSAGAFGPENIYEGEDEDEEEDSDSLFGKGYIITLNFNMGVNHFTAPHTISGNCAAYLYVDRHPGSYHWSLTEEKVWPVLYSHDPTHDRPGVIKSSDGGYISNDVGRSAGPPRGWRSADVVVDGTIQQGQQFWFGFFFRGVQPRYDFGGRFYRGDEAWPYQSSYAGLRQTFYHYPIEIETDTYTDAQGNEIEYETWSEPSYEIKLSMYLDYVVPSANYARTLAQGATLIETRKTAGNYKRSAAQTARGTAAATRAAGFWRSAVQAVKSAMAVTAPLTLLRKLTQQAGIGAVLERWLSLLRKPTQTAGAGDGTQRVAQAKRAVADTGKPGTALGRKQSFMRSAAQTALGTTEATRAAGFWRSAVQAVKSAMAVTAPLTLLRELAQQAGAGAALGRWLSLLRKATQTAGAGDGTQRVTQVKRAAADIGKAGTAIGRKQSFMRSVAHWGNAAAGFFKQAGYVKRFQEEAGSADDVGVARKLALRLAEAAAALYALQAAGGFGRRIANTAIAGSAAGGMAGFFRALFGVGGSADGAGRFVDRLRVVHDTETAEDAAGHAADYLRGLFVEAGIIAEAGHSGDYWRKQQDTAGSEAVPLRHLFVFVRLVAGAYVRDYIIGRFLKSREELVIKSPVCRELVLESRLH
jgi:hypothetical protein